MTCAPTCKARRLAERHAAWREERARQERKDAFFTHEAKLVAESRVRSAIATARGGRELTEWGMPGAWLVER
jgi:hypothetical protein